MKKICAAMICVLLVLAPLCLGGCFGGEGPGSETASDPTASGAVSQPGETASAGAPGAGLLTEGIYIAEVFSYTGPYVEDGSNEPCRNVCAVRLSNPAGQNCRYLRFTLKTQGGEYAFTATTLLTGTEMTVLCDSKYEYTDSGIVSCEILQYAPFTETPSIMPDKLKLTYTDGFINVQNLTDAEMKNVYVYYKNTDEAGFLGGITYRTPVETLPAGGIAQARAANLHKDTSKILFVTVGPDG